MLLVLAMLAALWLHFRDGGEANHRDGQAWWNQKGLTLRSLTQARVASVGGAGQAEAPIWGCRADGVRTSLTVVAAAVRNVFGTLFLQECQSALCGCQEELEFSAASWLVLQLFVVVGSG